MQNAVRCKLPSQPLTLAIEDIITRAFDRRLVSPQDFCVGIITISTTASIKLRATVVLLVSERPTTESMRLTNAKILLCDVASCTAAPHSNGLFSWVCISA